jgi:hypothetical protein
MRKLLTSLLLSAILSIPTSVLACADIITVRGGGDTQPQVCFLTNSYTINGVEFCEYSC